MIDVQEKDAPPSAPLGLLILQASPFCNIDCSYCYLPNRSSTKRMTLETLEAALDVVFSSGLCAPRLTVLWHVGEPLALPMAFYAQAFALIEARRPPDIEVAHSIQTNGILLTDAWCALIQKHRVNIGVSVDGPELLHDRNRVTRAGAGTHRDTMAGIRRLQTHAIPFHVISVLTYEALEYPDELFEFYLSEGIDRVAFNVEEVEHANEESSLQREDGVVRFRKFLSRFRQRVDAEEASKIMVREFESATTILRSQDLGRDPRSDHTVPFGIVSVDWEGSFSTFSPELLGAPSAEYDGFVIGNVHTDSIQDVAASEKVRRIREDIEAGIEMCRETCEYFAVCGGGAPSNKFFENGTFRSAETMFCRLHRQAVIDVFLGEAEDLIAGGVGEASNRAPAEQPQIALDVTSEARAPDGFEGSTIVAAGRVAPHRHFLGRWRPSERLQVNGGARRRDGGWFAESDWRPPSEAELTALSGGAEGAAVAQVFTFPEGLRERLLGAGLTSLNPSAEASPGAPARRELSEELRRFLSFVTRGRIRFLRYRFLASQPDQPSVAIDPTSEAAPGLRLLRSPAWAPGAQGVDAPAFDAQGPSAVTLFNLSDEPSYLVICNLRLGEMERILASEPASGAVSGRAWEDSAAEVAFLHRFPRYPWTKIALNPGEGCFLAPGEVVHDLCTVGMADVSLHLVAHAASA